MTSRFGYSPNEQVSRRSMLKAGAGLGIIGLAGCLGGDNGTTVTIGASSDGSASYGSMQALQRSLSNHGEAAQMNTTAPGGDPDAIRAYDAGEIDGYTAGNFVFNQALNDDEPFDEEPVEDFAYQALSFLSLHMHWLAVDGVEVNSIEEAIEEELNIWVGPPGWGLRTLCTSLMDDAGLWDNIENPVDVASEDVAAQVDEDRIDVFFGYGTNFNSLPGWLVEVDSRADLRALEMGDDYVAAIEDSEAGFEEIEPYGYEQDIELDEIQCWTEDYNTYFSPDMENDVVYEILEVSHEHWEEARESDANYMDHSDPASLAEYYHENIPVHSGAADFLEDNDAWDDSWERGD